jgi:hypothetical protein
MAFLIESSGLLLSGLATSTKDRTKQVPYLIDLLRDVGLNVDTSPLESYLANCFESLPPFCKAISYANNGAVLLQLSNPIRAGVCYEAGRCAPLLSVHSQVATNSPGKPIASAVYFQLVDYDSLAGAYTTACCAVVPDYPDLLPDALATTQAFLNLRMAGVALHRRPIAVMHRARYYLNGKHNVGLYSIVIPGGDAADQELVRRRILGAHTSLLTIYETLLMWWAPNQQQAEMLFTGNDTFQTARLLAIEIRGITRASSYTSATDLIASIRRTLSPYVGDDLFDSTISITIGVHNLYRTGWAIPTSYLLQYNLDTPAPFLQAEATHYLQLLRQRFGKTLSCQVKGASWTSIGSYLVGAGYDFPAKQLYTSNHNDRLAAFLRSQAGAQTEGIQSPLDNSSLPQVSSFSSALITPHSETTHANIIAPPTTIDYAIGRTLESGAINSVQGQLVPAQLVTSNTNTEERLLNLEANMEQMRVGLSRIESLLTLQLGTASQVPIGNCPTPQSAPFKALLGNSASDVESK